MPDNSIFDGSHSEDAKSGKKKSIIIYFILGALLVTIVTLYGVSSSECTATDDNVEKPVFETHKAFSKKGACEKALTMCKYYSPVPNNCRIKE